MVTIYTAYNALRLVHLEESVQELSERIYSKRVRLGELLETDMFDKISQKTNYENLEDYDHMLKRIAGEVDSLREFLKKRISDRVKSTPAKMDRLFEILGINPEEIL